MTDKYDDLNLSDYDKKIIKKRIEMENRKWVSGQIFKWIWAIIVAIFIFKVMAR